MNYIQIQVYSNHISTPNLERDTTSFNPITTGLPELVPQLEKILQKFAFNLSFMINPYTFCLCTGLSIFILIFSLLSCPFKFCLSSTPCWNFLAVIKGLQTGKGRLMFKILYVCLIYQEFIISLKNEDKSS